MKIFLYITITLLFLGGCKLKEDNNPVEPPTDPANDVLVEGVIQNGDFELTEDNLLPKYWTTNIAGSPQFNFFNLDTLEKQSELRALKINFIDSLSFPDSVNGSWGGIYQVLTINEFTAGNKYFLRFWVKADVGRIHVRIVQNADMDNPLLSYVVPIEKKWVEYRIGFTTEPTTSFMWLYINTKPALAEFGNVSAWVDNFRIYKQ